MPTIEYQTTVIRYTLHIQHESGKLTPYTVTVDRSPRAWPLGLGGAGLKKAQAIFARLNAFSAKNGWFVAKVSLAS